jgi:protein gp37
MALKSLIEWTESTWNPLTGCSKVSAGCQHCYAERMAKRLQAMGQPNYARGFRLTLHHDVLELPLRWKKPRMVFVASMSDLFHEKVPWDFIRRTFDVMNKAHWHTFQVLTKRSDRLAKLNPRLHWTPNIWMGVTVENKNYLHRIDSLLSTSAVVKFLSLEPLLGPLTQLEFHGIHWVIAGGESGPASRPMKESWVVNVRDQCLRASVPFFFKQWGGTKKKKNGRALEGRTWDQLPESATLPKKHLSGSPHVEGISSSETAISLGLAAPRA